jgi:hypothetical protein
VTSSHSRTIQILISGFLWGLFAISLLTLPAWARGDSAQSLWPYQVGSPIWQTESSSSDWTHPDPSDPLDHGPAALGDTPSLLNMPEWTISPDNNGQGSALGQPVSPQWLPSLMIDDPAGAATP